MWPKCEPCNGETLIADLCSMGNYKLIQLSCSMGNLEQILLVRECSKSCTMRRPAQIVKNAQSCTRATSLKSIGMTYTTTYCSKTLPTIPLQGTAYDLKGWQFDCMTQKAVY